MSPLLLITYLSAVFLNTHNQQLTLLLPESKKTQKHTDRLK